MLKKILCFSLILCLCGCSKTQNVNPILEGIFFKAKIICDKSIYVCDCEIANDSLKLVVNDPEIINGLTFVIDKNAFKSEFNGIKYDISNVDLIKSNIISDLYQIILNAKSQIAEYVNDNCIIEGNYNNINYYFVLSPSGLPKMLYVDEYDLSIEFNNVSLMNESEGG